MKKFLRYYVKNKIPFICLILVIACGSPQQAAHQNKEVPTEKELVKKYEQLAIEKFKGDLLYIPNANNTYMLCISNNKPTKENPLPSFSYFIYDLKTDEIIYEDSHENGMVNWKNNEQIMVHTFPGQVRSDNDRPVVYIYDIKKKKKFIDEVIKEK